MNILSIQRLRLLIQCLFFVAIVFGVVSGFADIWSNLLIVLFFLTAVVGNFYCGWVCPFGTLQEFLGKAGSKIVKKKIRPSPALANYLKYSKYLIYFIIVLNGFLGFAGSFSDTASFNGNFSFMSITAMLASSAALTAVSSLALVYLLLYLVAALFVDRPFCNYFCPDSIKYNLTSFLRLVSVKRDEEKCVHCKKCDNSCPMQIDISTAVKLRSANCINCMLCISACPVKGALQYRV